MRLEQYTVAKWILNGFVDNGTISPEIANEVKEVLFKHTMPNIPPDLETVLTDEEKQKLEKEREAKAA
jgi:microcompartment protein CcmL/EutN